MTGVRSTSARSATTVYAFAEHPGRGYAFVLQGTLIGDRIKGQWWDIPKHGRSTRGTIELQVSQNGTRLTRKSADTAIGVSVLTRIDPRGRALAEDRPRGGVPVDEPQRPRREVDRRGRPAHLPARDRLQRRRGHRAHDGHEQRPDWSTVFIGTREPAAASSAPTPTCRRACVEKPARSRSPWSAGRVVSLSPRPASRREGFRSPTTRSTSPACARC